MFVSAARKESAKEKQLKEEEKILESVAEGRGTVKDLSTLSGLLSHFMCRKPIWPFFFF